MRNFKRPKGNVFDGGEVLKELRVRAGMTLADVNEAIGINTGNLSSMENGHVRPSKKVLVTLFYLYKIDINNTTLITEDMYLILSREG